MSQYYFGMCDQWQKAFEQVLAVSFSEFNIHSIFIALYAAGQASLLWFFSVVTSILIAAEHGMRRLAMIDIWQLIRKFDENEKAHEIWKTCRDLKSSEPQEDLPQRELKETSGIIPINSISGPGDHVQTYCIQILRNLPEGNFSSSSASDLTILYLIGFLDVFLLAFLLTRILTFVRRSTSQVASYPQHAAERHVVSSPVPQHHRQKGRRSQRHNYESEHRNYHNPVIDRYPSHEVVEEQNGKWQLDDNIATPKRDLSMAFDRRESVEIPSGEYFHAMHGAGGTKLSQMQFEEASFSRSVESSSSWICQWFSAAFQENSISHQIFDLVCNCTTLAIFLSMVFILVSYSSGAFLPLFFWGVCCAAAWESALPKKQPSNTNHGTQSSSHYNAMMDHSVGMPHPPLIENESRPSRPSAGGATYFWNNQYRAGDAHSAPSQRY